MGRVGVSGRVFLAAGHELAGGAKKGLRESPYNARVAVLAVARPRERGREAWLAPLTTAGYPHGIERKLAWIGERARPGDLAVDVHLDIGEPGCAVFARERPACLASADALAAEIAEATGLRCRGGMPERETAAGRLAFLHGAGCDALLVELCSMNTADASFARTPGALARFAAGLAAGCEEALAIPSATGA